VMHLVAFGVAVVFLPNTVDGATAPRWALMGVGTALVCLWMKELKLTWGHVLGLVFALFAFSHMHSHPDSWQAGAQLAILSMVFVSGQTWSPRVFDWFGYGLLASSAAVILQFGGFPLFIETASPSGLFLNRNLLGEIAALMLIAALWRHRWWLAAGIAPSLILAQSRGAYLSFGVMLLLWQFTVRPKVCIFLAGIITVGIGYLAFAQSRLSAVTERVGIWLDTLHNIGWFGHGLGSYYQLYPLIKTQGDILDGRAEHAHNDFLEIAFELGPMGLALFVGVVVVALCARSGAQTQLFRLVLVGGLVQAVFSFPFHMPATGFILAGCMGWLVAQQRGLRFTLAGGKHNPQG
jgi:hypothetical protein